MPYLAHTAAVSTLAVVTVALAVAGFRAPVQLVPGAAGPIGISLAAQTGEATKNNGSKPRGGGSTNGTFELKGSAVGLFPGASTTIPLKIENYSNTAIKITEISATVRSVSASACSPAQLLLGTEGTGTVAVSLVIAGNGTGSFAFPVRMDLRRGVLDDSCQATTWTLDYSGKAVKA